MASPESVLVEVAVGTVSSALAAAAAGAHRIELCGSLVEGGTTPSIGMLARVLERVTLPIQVLIRPRGGDFHYDGDEIGVMLRDIAAARAAGAVGAVIGALAPDGRVDRELTGLLAEAARPLAVTFHRAFDLTRDPAEALDDLIELGIERLLTSGQAPTAEQGVPVIAALVSQAAGRIAIMPGGGINPDNAARIVAETGVKEIHVGASGTVPSAMEFRREGVYMGKAYQPDEYRRVETDPERIRTIISRLSP